MAQKKIPRTMSTQHPDNVRMPFFIENSIIGGEDEIKEAFYVFDHLKCEEQLWDAEGKEADTHVVKKLLSLYPSFFKEHKLGEDLFLTIRVPNPRIDKSEGKILLEALESIPRNSDIAKIFYEKEHVPVFEVCLPMTQRAEEVQYIEDYYKKFIGGKEGRKLNESGITVGEWIGEFKPDHINVIPLIEEKESILNADKIIGTFIEGKKIEHQRMWLAFSDPAENYGMLSTAFLNKIALQKLHVLEEKSSVAIYPILGMGGSPFRGNLLPGREKLCMEEYSSAQTYSIQSAFKYDGEEKEIRQAIENINQQKRGKPKQIEEERALEIVERYAAAYQKQVESLAELINRIAEYVPSRRKRKLHTGLFGYSRKMGKQKLPRAIKFCAALYSIGIPPALLGLNVLTDKDWEFVLENYPKMKQDVEDAYRYVNEANMITQIKEGSEILSAVKDRGFDLKIGQVHAQHTTQIKELLAEHNHQQIQSEILEAGWIRKFLG